GPILMGCMFLMRTHRLGLVCSQRIAADVLRLRKAGMPVVTTTVEVHDNLTGTTRKIPAYHL
ncbi:hypothetical protein O5202_26335, partial [Escherichia coli]|nr:hypothetical protein [Escherichia coli]